MKKESSSKVFFQSLEENEIAEVISFADVIITTQNELLFRRGDESDGFYIISNGRLEIFSHEKGEEVRLGIIKAGSIVGEIGFLDSQERTASARAITDVVSLKISLDIFTKLEEANIKLAIKVMQEIQSILAERLRQSDKLLVDYQTVKVDDTLLQKLNKPLRQTI